MKLASFALSLISKSFTNLNSHKFQPQGRRPTAGMDVVARSNDPPTGQGVSRIAKIRGGGGGRWTCDNRVYIIDGEDGQNIAMEHSTFEVIPPNAIPSGGPCPISPNPVEMHFTQINIKNDN